MECGEIRDQKFFKVGDKGLHLCLECAEKLSLFLVSSEKKRNSARVRAIDKTRLVEMYNQGLKFSIIAGEFGCSEITARNIIKEMGIQKRPYPLKKTITEGQRARFIEMCESPLYGYPEIAEEMGICYRKCMEYVKEHNIDYNRRLKPTSPMIKEKAKYEGVELEVYNTALEMKAQGVSMFRAYGMLNKDKRATSVIYIVQDAYNYNQKGEK
jgi:hypothetical protein